MPCDCYIQNKSRNQFNIKQSKKRPSIQLRDRIKNLDIKIRNIYFNQNRTKLRKDIRAGNSKSLWNSVKIARDIIVEPIPNSSVATIVAV